MSLLAVRGLHVNHIAQHIMRLGLAQKATMVLGWFLGCRRVPILRITDLLVQEEVQKY
jgi:hypothetical protein